MPAVPAVPAFGQRLNVPAYYDSVQVILNALRPHSTLRIMANHLNAQGFLTPSGLTWNRRHVSNFLRKRGTNKSKTEKE